MPQIVGVSGGEPHPTVATKAELSPAAEEMEVLQVMPAAFLNQFCWCLGKRKDCLCAALGAAGRDAAEHCPRNTAVLDPLLCFSPLPPQRAPLM